jgi:hypothetical protein
VIRRLRENFAASGATIEVRNQARVHLWYPQKHGLLYPALTCSTQGVDRFLTQNTQVGIRRRPDGPESGYEIYAPYGFDDIERIIVRPNRRANFSAANYAAKAALEKPVAGDHGAGRRGVSAGQWRSPD